VGVTDEHFCSDCKKPIEKATEKYIEAEFPNAKEPMRATRVFLCQKCARKSKVTVGAKKMTVWQLFKQLRHRGNPKFEVGIHCYSAPVCGTYEPRKGRMNCANIAVDPDGRMYCKRLHPGFVTLPQEKAIVERSRFDQIMRWVRRFSGLAGFRSVQTAMRAYGLDPVLQKDVYKHGPVGKNITNA